MTDPDVELARKVFESLSYADDLTIRDFMDENLEIITKALKQARLEGYKEAFITIPNPSYSQSEVDRVTKLGKLEGIKLGLEAGADYVSKNCCVDCCVYAEPDRAILNLSAEKILEGKHENT